jgi:crotonobetainyl-CoA:carnitine CoA-transferase CaiB-like acyl-CoA transferase
VVDTSLLETALAWAGQKTSAYVNMGKVPERHASGHPSFVPYEAFNASDGPFLICCGNDRLFAKLATEIGRPEWVTDPRFATNRARLANKAALLAPLSAILAAAPRADWLVRLERAGIPCAPINSIPEVLEEPQVQAMGMMQPVPGEDFRLTGLPISFDGERPAPKGPAPRLGEHNGDFFAEYVSAEGRRPG